MSEFKPSDIRAASFRAGVGVHAEAISSGGNLIKEGGRVSEFDCDGSNCQIQIDRSSFGEEPYTLEIAEPAVRAAFQSFGELNGSFVKTVEQAITGRTIFTYEGMYGSGFEIPPTSSHSIREG